MSQPHDTCMFAFPVAIDAQWRTLKQWWLTQHPKGWTSISVLLDQGGVIRAVHAGGVYTEEEVARLKALIETLLGPLPHP